MKDMGASVATASLSKGKTVLALAAHHNRIAFCFLVDGQPMDWQLVYRAATSPARAKMKAEEWINFYAPDVIVTEDPKGFVRKRRVAENLTTALREAAIESDALHVEFERQQNFENKYDEIEALCLRFPAMRIVKPRRRRVYEQEPSATTIFEALSLALQLEG